MIKARTQGGNIDLINCFTTLKHPRHRHKIACTQPDTKGGVSLFPRRA